MASVECPSSERLQQRVPTLVVRVAVVRERRSRAADRKHCLFGRVAIQVEEVTGRAVPELDELGRRECGATVVSNGVAQKGLDSLICDGAANAAA